MNILLAALRRGLVLLAPHYHMTPDFSIWRFYGAHAPLLNPEAHVLNLHHEHRL